ncbi:Pyrophosphate--fructose 6-phosphate 1-phosphotransferase [Melia azedarach]|uniref:Pyrophosphate--fructose 6-phosphate 1-phosphotransferase n=1 Tax=Melia azedarach TaxID=155640 RepID=A0ACC1YM06_MELAZ|nr:Pyrophosphate--fructose 6-phosphate 1-phosphotransferase [Melia azedarach]
MYGDLRYFLMARRQGEGNELEPPYVEFLHRQLLTMQEEIRELRTSIGEPRSPDILGDFIALLIDSVKNVTLPGRFKMLQLHPYHGQSDPVAYMEIFQNLMLVQGVLDEIMCKMFPTTLSGSIRTWYKKHPSGSIRDFTTFASIKNISHFIRKIHLCQYHIGTHLSKGNSHFTRDTFVPMHQCYTGAHFSKNISTSSRKPTCASTIQASTLIRTSPTSPRIHLCQCTNAILVPISASIFPTSSGKSIYANAPMPYWHPCQQGIIPPHQGYLPMPTVSRRLLPPLKEQILQLRKQVESIYSSAYHPLNTFREQSHVE